MFSPVVFDVCCLSLCLLLFAAVFIGVCCCVLSGFSRAAGSEG